MPHHWHPLAHERNSIFKCKQHIFHDPCGSDKYDYTMMKHGRHFTTATQALNTSYSKLNLTDERESPQEAWPAWENSSLGFIEAVHQWLWQTMSLSLLVLISFIHIELILVDNRVFLILRNHMTVNRSNMVLRGTI